jgi:hypothetical protein
MSIIRFMRGWKYELQQSMDLGGFWLAVLGRQETDDTSSMSSTSPSSALSGAMKTASAVVGVEGNVSGSK